MAGRSPARLAAQRPRNGHWQMAAVATDLDLEALYEADSLEPCRVRHNGVGCRRPSQHLVRGHCLCGPRSAPICEDHRVLIAAYTEVRCYPCGGWITILSFSPLGS